MGHMGLNVIKVYYKHILECYNETNCFVQLMHVNLLFKISLLLNINERTKEVC